MRYRTLAERRRRAEAKAKDRQEDTAWAVDRVISNYVEAYRELYGHRPNIRYRNGWYKIYRDKNSSSHDSFRATEIMAMTGNLLARIHVRDNAAQIEQPELLEDN